MDDELLSVETFARECGGDRENGGLSKYTIYAWLTQGRIQRTKVGRRTFIRRSELAKVIQDGVTPIPA
jgi:excisionase family DNA binding protein